MRPRFWEKLTSHTRNGSLHRSMIDFSSAKPRRNKIFALHESKRRWGSKEGRQSLRISQPILRRLCSRVKVLTKAGGVAKQQRRRGCVWPLSSVS